VGIAPCPPLLQSRLDRIAVFVVSYGTGHINDTFVRRVRTSGGIRKFIHQRINHFVFKEPAKVQETIGRITAHLKSKIIAAGGDPEREATTIVPALDGAGFVRDERGNYWRTFMFIDGARTFDRIDRPARPPARSGGSRRC